MVTGVLLTSVQRLFASVTLVVLVVDRLMVWVPMKLRVSCLVVDTTSRARAGALRVGKLVVLLLVVSRLVVALLVVSCADARFTLSQLFAFVLLDSLCYLTFRTFLRGEVLGTEKGREIRKLSRTLPSKFLKLDRN